MLWEVLVFFGLVPRDLVGLNEFRKAVPQVENAAKGSVPAVPSRGVVR